MDKLLRANWLEEYVQETIHGKKIAIKSRRVQVIRVDPVELSDSKTFIRAQLPADVSVSTKDIIIIRDYELQDRTLVVNEAKEHLKPPNVFGEPISVWKKVQPPLKLQANLPDSVKECKEFVISKHPSWPVGLLYS